MKTNAIELRARPLRGRAEAGARLGLLAGAAACAVAAAAVAQDTPASSGSEIEIILVTAEKREESLQSISVPVTAIPAPKLLENQVLDLEDVQLLAPNTSFGNVLGVPNLAIRGVGTNSGTAGIDPSVALHVDGAVVNQPQGQFTSTFDLARVEVLRGPQGTLYGRNATGGSINLVTARPTEEFEGYGDFTFGDYSQMIAEGAVSGPINSTVLGRLSFRLHEHDGFGENVVTSNDVNNVSERSMRAQLQFLLTDNIDYRVAAEWHVEDDNNLGMHFAGASFPIWNDPSANLTDQQRRDLAPFRELGPQDPFLFATDQRDSASEIDFINEFETSSVTGELNWALSDSVTLVNITNWRDIDIYLVHDFDAGGVQSGPFTTGTPGSVHSRRNFGDHWSNELQLQYDGTLLGTGIPFDGIVAVYYFEEYLNGRNQSGLTATHDVNGLDRPRVRLDGELDTESWAVFGQGTLQLTDQLAIKLGARYTEEDRSFDNTNTIVLAAGLGPTIMPSLSDSKTFDDFSPLVGVEWTPTDDILAYYTYSEGYKSGAALLGQTSSLIADPETIENHEIGVKTTWLDRRALVNLTAFSYEVQDLQLGRTIPAPGGGTGFTNLFENAGGMEGEGVELELQLLPVDQLRIAGSVSYLDAKFTEFMSIDQFDPDIILDPASVGLTDLSGNRPRYAPEWSYVLDADFDFPTLPNGGLVTLGGTASYKDEQFFEEFNAESQSSDAYTILDARLTYAPPHGDWEASLWGKNITDEEVVAGTFGVALTRTIGATYLPPRTWGARVSYRF